MMSWAPRFTTKKMQKMREVSVKGFRLFVQKKKGHSGFDAVKTKVSYD